MKKVTDTARESAEVNTNQDAPRLPVTPKPRRKPSALQGRLARDHGLDFF